MKCKKCGHEFEPKERYYGHLVGASTTTACIHKTLKPDQCPKCWHREKGE